MRVSMRSRMSVVAATTTAVDAAEMATTPSALCRVIAEALKLEGGADLCGGGESRTGQGRYGLDLHQ